MKDKRKDIKLPLELWKRIKSAAHKNNRKIIDDLREKYK